MPASDRFVIVLNVIEPEVCDNVAQSPSAFSHRLRARRSRSRARGICHRACSSGR
jgi:hypothetical protein